MRQPTSGPERAALLVINTLRHQPQGSKRRHQAFVTSLATNNRETQGRQPASTMLAAYKLGTEHHETVLPLITSDHKLCPEEEDCPADNRERRNTTTTNNHATPSRGCHGRDETVDRETETGKKPKPREDNYDNVS